MQLPLPGLLKSCYACNAWKTLDEFNKNKCQPDGLDNRCRACVKRQRKKPFPKLANPAATRTCRACGRLKSYDQLTKHQNMIGGVDTICHECNKVKVAQYNTEHPERKPKYDRERYPQIREKVVVRSMFHYLKKRHTLTHKEQVKSACANRRARKLNAPGSYTTQDVRAQRSAQNGLCYWCSEPLGRYHADHYIPLARGGTNWPDNIVASCPRCNFRKNDRMPYEEWQPPNPLHPEPKPKTARICRLSADRQAE